MAMMALLAWKRVWWELLLLFECFLFLSQHLVVLSTFYSLLLASRLTLLSPTLFSFSEAGLFP